MTPIEQYIGEIKRICDQMTMNGHGRDFDINDLIGAIEYNLDRMMARVQELRSKGVDI